MLSRISRHFACMTQGLKPVRTRKTDAGFDVFVSERTEIETGGFEMVPTGSKIRCPEGYFIQIVARSSSISNRLLVPTAIIDAEYNGEIFVGTYNLSNNLIILEEGDRIAQLIFSPILHPSFDDVAKFPDTGRGIKGFGSSGK